MWSKVPQDKLALIIGKKGVTIQALQARYQVSSMPRPPAVLTVQLQVTLVLPANDSSKGEGEPTRVRSCRV